jgi:hypothetical protein
MAEDHLERLRALREAALLGGGPERVAQQHARGKGTARERLARLLDPDSFQEPGSLARHQVSDYGLATRRYPFEIVVETLGSDRYQVLLEGKQYEVTLEPLVEVASVEVQPGPAPAEEQVAPAFRRARRCGAAIPCSCSR